jgi:hypothetical protein
MDGPCLRATLSSLRLCDRGGLTVQLRRHPTEGMAAHTSATDRWTAPVIELFYRAADLRSAPPHTRVVQLPGSWTTVGTALSRAASSPMRCARGTAMLPAWYTASSIKALTDPEH